MFNAVDLERAVLGGMLISPDTADVVLSMLKPEYFYLDSNRKIFSYFKRLCEEEGRWVDGKIFLQRMRDEGKLEEIGGVKYLIEITQEGIVETSEDGLVELYCTEIENKYKIRRALELMQSTKEFKFIQEPLSLLERVQEILLSLRKEEESPKQDIPGRLKELIVSRVEHPDMVNGIPTGWKDLDLLLDGLHGGRLYLIAGRPGMGKSSFMICMARDMAQRGIKVGIFSLEMSVLQIYEWMVSQRAMANIRRPRKKDLPKLLSAVDEVVNLPVVIDDSTTWIGDIVRKASKWKREGVQVVFLDHILLVDEEGRDTYERVSSVSKKLKALAKALDVPVVVLCQLSRKVEERGGEHIPRLSDLRDSGKLEENADVVMFIHRPKYYDATPLKDKENVAYVIVAKQRDGALGTVDFMFIEEQRRFELLAKDGR